MSASRPWRCRLTVFNGPHTGLQIGSDTLGEGTSNFVLFTIGRRDCPQTGRSPSHLCLREDKGISSLHCHIATQGSDIPSLIVRDCCSSNGTLIWPNRDAATASASGVMGLPRPVALKVAKGCDYNAQPGHVLVDGCVISIGSTLILVSIDGEAAPLPEATSPAVVPEQAGQAQALPLLLPAPDAKAEGKGGEQQAVEDDDVMVLHEQQEEVRIDAPRPVPSLLQQLSQGGGVPHRPGVGVGQAGKGKKRGRQQEQAGGQVQGKEVRVAVFDKPPVQLPRPDLSTFAAGGADVSHVSVGTTQEESPRSKKERTAWAARMAAGDLSWVPGKGVAMARQAQEAKASQAAVLPTAEGASSCAAPCVCAALSLPPVVQQALLHSSTSDHALSTWYRGLRGEEAGQLMTGLGALVEKVKRVRTVCGAAATGIQLPPHTGASEGSYVVVLPLSALHGPVAPAGPAPSLLAVGTYGAAVPQGASAAPVHGVEGRGQGQGLASPQPSSQSYMAPPWSIGQACDARTLQSQVGLGKEQDRPGGIGAGQPPAWKRVAVKQGEAQAEEEEEEGDQATQADGPAGQDDGPRVAATGADMGNARYGIEAVVEREALPQAGPGTGSPVPVRAVEGGAGTSGTVAQATSPPLLISPSLAALLQTATRSPLPTVSPHAPTPLLARAMSSLGLHVPSGWGREDMLHVLRGVPGVLTG